MFYCVNVSDRLIINYMLAEAILQIGVIPKSASIVFHFISFHFCSFFSAVRLKNLFYICNETCYGSEMVALTKN